MLPRRLNCRKFTLMLLFDNLGATFWWSCLIQPLQAVSWWRFKLSVRVNEPLQAKQMWHFGPWTLFWWRFRSFWRLNAWMHSAIWQRYGRCGSNALLATDLLLRLLHFLLLVLKVVQARPPDLPNNNSGSCWLAPLGVVGATANESDDDKWCKGLGVPVADGGVKKYLFLVLPPPLWSCVSWHVLSTSLPLVFMPTDDDSDTKSESVVASGITRGSGCW